MAVTRDDVIHTAILLLQEVGLDGLTLRRLATELGISAPTLYWHVRDKRELLDLMADTMMIDHRAKQPPFPVGLEWWQVIAEGVSRQFDAIIAYRDGARVVAGNRPTPGALPMIERYLKVWIDAGFSPDEAIATLLSFGDFVVGSALEYQAENERQRLQTDTDRADLWKAMEAYPILRAASAARALLPTRDSFEHGLGLLIAGLRHRQAELVAEKQRAAEQPRPQPSDRN